MTLKSSDAFRLYKAVASKIKYSVAAVWFLCLQKRPASKIAFIMQCICFMTGFEHGTNCNLLCISVLLVAPIEFLFLSKYVHEEMSP